MMVGHHQTARRNERRRENPPRNTHGRESDVIEPLLIRSEVVGPAPVIERRRVEGPHSAELGPIGGRRKRRGGGLPRGRALGKSLAGNNERGSQRKRTEHGLTRQHFCLSCS